MEFSAEEQKPEADRGAGGSGEHDFSEAGAHLVLPCDNAQHWAYVQEVLTSPLEVLSDLDTMLTKFRSVDPDREQQQVCTFFKNIPGSAEAGEFDFNTFFAKGVPLLLEVALDMPKLFEGTQVPIFKMRSSWTAARTLGKKSFSLSRRQCACLLAHSFLGSLQRPKDVQRNDFRFTVVDLFMGTAVSPNSATIFLNYFTMLGKNGIPDGLLTFERMGFKKGQAPWQWEQNEKPLCHVQCRVGAIEDSVADVHVEYANAFVGGGVMTGDAAMEEVLFLVKPELMVAMALENRMVDEEVICISGALQYSLTTGYGTSLEFAGDYDNRRVGHPPKVCAIDAVRGGSNLEKRALLRDLDKARIAFEGALEVATGHWGCGAYGNNQDFMFLKQWMAASEAGVSKVYYHDFDRKHSHHILQLERKLRHMKVGQLWDLLRSVEPYTVAAFCTWVTDVCNGKVALPGKDPKTVPESPDLPTGGYTSVADTRESGSNNRPVGPPEAAVKQAERASPISQLQVPVVTGSHEDQTPSSEPGETHNLEGKTVIYKGTEMTCLKENGGQVRLQRMDGSSTWASKKDVTAK